VTRPTHQVFLPLILRNFTGGGIALGRVQPSASAANGLDLAGYELTDEDGNTFTIPDALPPLPLNGFVVIRFGAGTDETDFSDGRATLYTGADLAGSLADNRDQVALYATRSHNADTIVDFVAWGGPAGEDGANAVAAGLWQASEFVNLAVGGGAVEEGATLPQDRGLGLHPGRDWGTSAAWVVYQDSDLSPGTANPVPRAYWSNAGPAAEMSRDGFAIGWSVAPGARYRLQMDDNADFSSPEVDTRVEVPLYAPDVAPPVGHYWWRVRTRDDGVTSAWSAPREVTLVAGEGPSVARVDQTILNNMTWLRQRKDSPLLCLDGDPEGDPDASPPKHAWDATHPDRIFNHGSMNCVRAAIAMIVTQYGGDLSQDRLSYRLFENFGNPIENRGGVGTVRSDLGHNLATGVCGGNGSSGTTLMAWALGTNASNITYSGGSPSWNQVTTWINNGRPIMRFFGGHQTVIGGYRTLNNGTQQVRLYDPWSGTTWQTYNSMTITCHYVGPTSAPNVRSDESGIWNDTDGDGIMDWDEQNRFGTDSGVRDSDGDWVNDKQDMRAYVFDRFGNYDFRDADYDNDGDRKEVDCDNDNDGSPDGCEDVDQDGITDYVDETDNFDVADSQACIPRVNILDPTTNQQVLVGTYDDPLKFVIRLKLAVPDCGTMPSLSPGDFEIAVGSSSRKPVINGFPVGQEYWLLVEPPTQSMIGDYDLKVYYDGNARIEEEENAVSYMARLITDQVLVLDTSGSMSELNKLTSAQNAARLFIDQWVDGDMIGTVAFSTTASVPYSLTAITESGSEQADAKAAVNALSAGGLTAMGSGLLEGQTQLDTRGGTGHKQVMVLLSDGIENVPPKWTDSTVRDPIVNAGTIVHTVGLGPSDAAWYGRLSDIASATGGEFRAVNQYGTTMAADASDADTTSIRELAGEAGVQLQPDSTLFPSTLENRLADIYQTIVETIKVLPRLWQATGTLDESDSQDTHTIQIIGGLGEATFTVNWSDASEVVDLQLTRPNGSVVSPGDSDVLDYKAGNTHEHYRLSQPSAGNWEILLTYIGGESTEYITFIAAPVEAITGHVIGVPQSARVLDASIPLMVYLADDAPITGAEVLGEIAHPDFRFEQITLYDDGEHGDGEPDDGVYATRYRPFRTGLHQVKFRVEGTDNAGNPLTRYMTGGFNVLPRVAYLYNNQEVATRYEGLLEDHGMAVDPVPMDDITTTSFEAYQLIMAGPDTGSFDSWGTPQAVDAISETNTSVIGLGEGGYALFGKLDLDIGYPNGLHGDENQVVVVDETSPVFSTPYAVTDVPSDTLTLYDTTSHIGIYLPDVPWYVTVLGQEPTSADHYSLVRQDFQYLLWGFEASPASMTETGRRTFVNSSWSMVD
jgi:Mg-chelatase subunit ChlD